MPNGFFLTATFRNYLNTTSARLTITSLLNGQVQITSYDLPLVSDSTIDQTLYVAVGGLQIIHASVSLIDFISNNGFCHCVLSLNKGRGATSLRLSILATSYITCSQSCSWPWTDSNSLDSSFHSLVSYSNSPAPGNPAVITVPAGLSYCLRGLKAPFTTSVAVANRYALIYCRDATPDIILGSCSSSAMAAGNAVTIYGSNVGELCSFGNLVRTILIPDVWLNEGYSFLLDIYNIDVADGFGTVEWFIESRICH